MEVKVLLEDGTSVIGQTPNEFDHVTGELVFNTGMTGYQEVMTDPSYAGQIVMMTYPLIGNYGFRVGDDESSKVQVKAFIVREASKELLNYAWEQGIPLIYGLDTRMLTKKIRRNGTMTCLIKCHADSNNDLTEISNYTTNEKIIKEVSCKQIMSFPGGNIKVGILDFGVKKSIIKRLKSMDCSIVQFPHNTSSKVILNHQLDMLLLSNGPGDPKWASKGIKCCEELIGKIPIRGICLGHQIIALALGGDTYKLKFGHRGSNHPVMELKTKKVYITSQNHGYAVKEERLPEEVEVTYRNINDQTIEGLEIEKYDIKSIQFHPEEGPGPEEGHIILDNWIKELQGGDATCH